MSPIETAENRLRHEKSPYLLQHRENPVWWWPWSDAAFERARAEGKPVFLSIGYSTCYWCHVMEQDSFEHDEVAEVLNREFICIKVDREEHPDVDAVYMDAVVGMTGHGGWPMSVFLTPDREPFYGATFFYRAHFINVLEQIARAWKNEREKILHSGKKIAEFLQERGTIPISGDDDALLAQVVEQARRALSQRFDSRFGGFGAAPKFPPTGAVALLLRSPAGDDRAEALQMALVTLEQMARGGIYDQLAGGFARYSTDAQWLVPHFEKMLYDNGLLAVNYAEAYQITHNEFFRAIVIETLDWVLHEMTGPEGGFYSALDAGEVGKEGEFYVWSQADIRKILSSAEAEAFEQAYGVSADGNFEAKHNVLALQPAVAVSDRDSPLLHGARAKLLAERGKRERPHLDDKILTAWNGLMLSGFAKGFQITRHLRYREAGEKCARFLKRELYRDGILHRRFREGEARFHGYLEDYAYLISGLLDLFETTGTLEWLLWAAELQRGQDARFWDEKEGGYIFSDAPGILVRKKEYVDGATPAPNAIALMNLVRLDVFFGSEIYRQRIEQLEGLLLPLAARAPEAFCRTIMALDREHARSREIVISAGMSHGELERFLADYGIRFMPDTTLALMTGDPREKEVPLLLGRYSADEKPSIYICENRSCRLPLHDFEAARAALASA